MADLLLLVTGGAGFIGSNFIHYVFKKNNKFNILNLDNLTYAGNLINLKTIENNNKYKFIKGDISNKKLVNKICETVSKKTGKPLKSLLSLIKYVKDRPAHDFRYCLDTSKIYNELKWEAATDINDGLEKTVVWYLSNKDWIKSVFNKEYK